MRYFGPPWDASIVEHATQAATPVGVRCMGGCGHPIADVDQGLLVPHVDDRGVCELAWHRRCWLVEVTGAAVFLVHPDH